MLIKRTRGWELPERAATSESLYLNRRTLVKAMGLGAIATGVPGLALAEDDPSAKLYPAKKNDAFGSPNPVTAEKLSTTYNNFYEFADDKNIWRAAQKLPVRPWTPDVNGPPPAQRRRWPPRPAPSPASGPPSSTVRG